MLRSEFAPLHLDRGQPVEHLTVIRRELRVGGDRLPELPFGIGFPGHDHRIVESLETPAGSLERVRQTEHRVAQLPGQVRRSGRPKVSEKRVPAVQPAD